MDVPSAISLTDACTGPSAWNFGVVQPGTTALTDTGAGVCRMQFSSSNDSAQLRIAQRDGTSTAMSAPNNSSATLSPGYSHSQILVGRAYDSNLVFFGGTGYLDRWDGASWTTTSGLGTGLDSIMGVDFQPGAPSTWWIVGTDGNVLRSTNANGGGTHLVDHPDDDACGRRLAVDAYRQWRGGGLRGAHVHHRRGRLGCTHDQQRRNGGWLDHVPARRRGRA